MPKDNITHVFDAPAKKVHTLIIGSGAAGLSAAVQLHRHGVRDILILTEGLDMGTSINTGSDKQTYYKLGICGGSSDSVLDMASSYFDGGGMHGDLALVEAALSPRCFFNLVDLGLPFPSDSYGQFVGYKTDHDPRQRATSMGPYTSREICRALIREVKRYGIPLRERRVAVSLITVAEGSKKRAAGVLAVCRETAGTADTDKPCPLEFYAAENIVLAVGGPGGLYRNSVYPEKHTGGIGLALLAGARAQNLAESQYGLASTELRWNVSGSYMQVIPRFVSTDEDGRSTPCEFLRPYFASAAGMNSMIFLKGYQWPFDARKVDGGSSIIDILVYIETVIKGRRVFLDYRRNPEDFNFDDLSADAREYLSRSGALLETPLARLERMNPAAVQLYRDHGLDIAGDPLEIAVCAQHNNGGLAGNIWWESLNIGHLFPVGEVNGSHGIYRPGGAALNAGQVGALRAAEYIANRCQEDTLDMDDARLQAEAAAAGLSAWIKSCASAGLSWQEERYEWQRRMSECGAHIRSLDKLEKALRDAGRQWLRLERDGSYFSDAEGLIEALRNRQLCFAHLVYLEAICCVVRSGVGSRGSAIVLDRRGRAVHEALGDEWRFMPENDAFRERVLETEVDKDLHIANRWVARRPLPRGDDWFENVWTRFRQGDIYDAGG